MWFGGHTKSVIAALALLLVALNSVGFLFHGDAKTIFTGVVAAVGAVLAELTGPGGPGTVTRVARKTTKHRTP